MVETDNKFFIVETKIINNIDTYQLKLFSKIEKKGKVFLKILSSFGDALSHEIIDWNSTLGFLVSLRIKTERYLFFNYITGIALCRINNLELEYLLENPIKCNDWIEYFYFKELKKIILNYNLNSKFI